ncbi:MAG: Two-component response regulator AlgB [Phycisphaerales bacterium]|nr:Two-component response regulator AlgB [Phycisphaerales bacterium]
MADHPVAETTSLRILVIDDEANIRFALAMCLESAGHKVVAQGTIEGALSETSRQAFDLIFLDVRLGNDNGLDYIPALLQDNPWVRIVVITAYASIQTAVEAMKLGASDYLPKPFEHAQLLLLTRKVAERRQLERKMDALQRTLGSMDPEWDFPTSSPVWQDALEVARRVAASNVAVLVRGEPGTGRGRLARAIHAWSGRPNGPFTSVSLRGRSSDEVEMEIFGDRAERGGTVGGAVAMCHGGTLLLEEVGTLPLNLQPALVALLRDKEFERPDALDRRPIDVRVIATSDSDLEPLVVSGKFRTDLHSALNVIRIDVPPLRERAEDVPMLAGRYLAHFAREHHRHIVAFTRDALFLLKAHDWPGNIRELRNVVERAVLVCDSDQIGLKHLPAELISGKVTGSGEAVAGHAIGDLVPLKVIEEAHIRQVLVAARTTRRAAAILEIDPSTLFRKLKGYRYDEEPAGDKPSQ